MASLAIVVDAHVLLFSAEWSATRDPLEPASELLRINGIANAQEVLQSTGFFLWQTVEVGEVTGLVDLVDVGFLFREAQLFDDLLTSGFEQVLVDQGRDDGVFVGRAGFVLLVIGGDRRRGEEVGRKSRGHFDGGHIGIDLTLNAKTQGRELSSDGLEQKRAQSFQGGGRSSRKR